MQDISLMSINIEGNKHWERVLPFIDERQPEVLCLQEAFEPDLHLLHERGYTTHFLQMQYKPYENTYAFFGVVVATKLSVLSEKNLYYHRHSHADDTPFEQDNKRDTSHHGCALVTLEKEGVPLIVASTHFTWTPDGLTSPEQEADMTELLAVLEGIEPHVFCGDFNIPRGLNPQYDRLCERYTDTIPTTYASSLDKEFHKAAQIPEEAHACDTRMVDYIFTQPPYKAENVQLHFGISDHAAVVARITKAE